MKTKDFLALPHIKDEIKSRFEYNPNTGKLFWAYRNKETYYNYRVNKTIAGTEAGKIYKNPKDGYIAILVRLEVFGKKVNLVAARICWLCMTGDWPKHTIDHIDRDSTNNKWENLRDVTQAENNKNKGPYKKSQKYFLTVNNESSIRYLSETRNTPISRS